MVGKTGSRKHGREKNKLLRIRQSSGAAAAQEYAAKHMLTAWVRERGLL